MFGAALAKGVASLGGAGVTTAVVTGGLLVGVAGAIGTGLATPGGPTDELAILACPDEGPELARIAAGQEMLVTARTEDGSWLRIHFPEPGRTEAWVEAAALRVDGDLATLPVAGCGEVAVATSTPQPVATLTAANPFAPPTEGPETPEPTDEVTPPPTPVGPTPTPVAGDTTAPSLGTATISNGQIFGVAACGPTSTVIGVTVTDAVSGVSSVTLVARNAAAGSTRTVQMTAPLIGNVWTATLTAANVGAGTITFTLQARDGSGNQTPILSNNAWGFTSIASCDTTPPSVTLVAQGSSPTASTTISYAVTFSEPISGLAAGAFATSGTAPGCSVGSLTGSGAAWTLTVTCGGAGTLILTLGAGTVVDAAGNAGPASPTSAPTVTIDLKAPKATVSIAARTASSSPTFLVTFDEPVTGLAAGDFTLKVAGTTCAIGKIGAPKANAYPVEVICDKGVTTATVALTLVANSVADLAGNVGPESAAAAVTTIDRVGPTITNWTIQLQNGSVIAALPGPEQAICVAGTLISNGSFLFSANVADPAGIGTVELVMTHTHGTVHRYVMTFNAATGKYQVRISYGNDTSGQAYPWMLAVGDHQYRIETTDALGNKTTSGTGIIKATSCFLTTG